MSQGLSLLVEPQDIPLYMAAFDQLKDDELSGTLFNIGHIPDTGWVVRFNYATTRQVLLFCAAVYAELPEEREVEEVEAPEELVQEIEQEVSPAADPEEDSDSEEEAEDDAEEESEEEATPQTPAKPVKIVRKVTPTGDKNVTVETT